MNEEHVRDRLHHATHRAPKASEEELVEVTAVVLAVSARRPPNLPRSSPSWRPGVDALEGRPG